MPLPKLIKKFEQVFPEATYETLSIVFALLDCVPTSMSDFEIERARRARVNFYNRMLEIENEIVRPEKLLSNNIGRGIRS